MIRWTEVVIAIVAVYGAALSTYNLIKQHYANKPKIKIRIDIWPLLDLPESKIEPFIRLTAANSGGGAVTLLSPYLELPEKKRFYGYNPRRDVKFPHELLPEKSCRFT